MPAPKGNKFHLKDPKDRHGQRVAFRAKESEYKIWLQKAGTKKFAAWAREKLNK